MDKKKIKAESKKSSYFGGVGKAAGEPSKILIIQQKMIGDVLMSSILFDELKAHFPNCELHYLVNKNTVPVIENHRSIDRIIEFNPKENKQIFNLKSFGKSLQKENYNICIDVYSKISSAIISYFSNANVRIGKHKWYLNFAYTKSIKLSSKQEDPAPMAIVNRLDFLKPILSNLDYERRPKIYLRNSEIDNMKSILKKNNIDLDSKKMLMVNCLGSHPNKTYPLSFMAEILDQVAENHPSKLLLLNYIPSQKAEVKQLLSYCKPNTVQKISKFYAESLREFIVLTSLCEGVFGNEGGAINIGKALNLPTFAIFSPWINTKSWAENTESNKHGFVHLKDFKPELFKNKSTTDIKKKYASFYDDFSPKLFIRQLIDFLKS